MSQSQITIDLFGTPPTAGEIAVEQARLRDAIERTRRKQRRYVLGAFVTAGFAACIGQVFWHSWPVTLTVFIWLAGAIALVAFPPSEPTEVGVLSALDPVHSSHLGDILRACELDPRVDEYRRKVVLQQRDLVVAEAQAFSSWYHHGYATSLRWAAVRSPAQLQREDGEERQLAGEGSTL